MILSRKFHTPTPIRSLILSYLMLVIFLVFSVCAQSQEKNHEGQIIAPDNLHYKSKTLKPPSFVRFEEFIQEKVENRKSVV